MPLRRPRYASIAALLRREGIAEEEPATAALIRRLAHVRRRRAFGRSEFLMMCRWKSPRATPLYRLNPAARVRRVARAVLATHGERERITRLTSLRGVSVPVASAILTLIDPRRYGVLDIRVWQLLFALRTVGTRPGGRGFTIDDWLGYLGELRRHARALGVPARAIEWTLFRYHRKLQAGRLYDAPHAPAAPVRRRQAIGDAARR